ncbi:MFS transporter [Actinokineospora pegani]|uniref:MFS transporter n=1 Tax=Actinokineospora pegani TaxID=2654637 RepID=UPI0012EAE6D1|nr:MFS transporter [Actinokineospora pegani]
MATTSTPDGRMAWYRALPAQGRRAFTSSFLGYGLDSYDFNILPLILPAITAAFALSTGQTGVLSSAMLVSSAIGGVIAGVLCDRIGRVRTLVLTVLAFALFTALCGLASNYETLLVFRTLQGIGFGGEWATGAVLVAEYTAARHRGRTLAVVQSAWAVGWAAAAVVATVLLSVLDEDIAWRVVLFTGALPALLVLYLRRGVEDAPTRDDGPAVRGSFPELFRGPLLRTTLFASLLTTGVQGGYYTLAIWLPTFLRESRGLSVGNTGWFLVFLIPGAFLGYLCGGWFTDRLGRKRTIAAFAVVDAVLVVLYTQLPTSANAWVMVLGLPLGFGYSAIFSGFGAFLSELYPARVRGIGTGFTYNFGRGVGAVFPATVGFMATSFGVGGAMSFAAGAYVLAFLALLGLPETKDWELS